MSNKTRAQALYDAVIQQERDVAVLCSDLKTEVTDTNTKIISNYTASLQSEMLIDTSNMHGATMIAYRDIQAEICLYGDVVAESTRLGLDQATAKLDLMSEKHA